MTSIKIHIPGQKVSLFGLEASGFQRGIILGAVLGRLVHRPFNAKEAQPGLLEKWECLEGGQRWRLQFKQGLTFHNGRPLIAEDLEFTFFNILTSEYSIPTTSLLHNIKGAVDCPKQVPFKTGLISGIKIIDRLTVEIELIEKDPNFISLLEGPSLSPLPQEEIILNPLTASSNDTGGHITWKNLPVGAGPCQVVSADENGVRIQLTQQDAQNNMEVYTGAFEEGTDVSFGANARFLKNHVKVQASKTERLHGFYFNYLHPLGRNHTFRKAVSLCINRQAINESHPEGKPAWDMIPSEFRNYEIAQPAFDPDQARSLFASLDIEPMTIPMGVYRPAYMSLIEEQLHAAGCPLKLTTYEPNFSAMNEPDLNEPFHFVGFIPSLFSATEIFKVMQPGGSWILEGDEPDETYIYHLQQLQQGAGHHHAQALSEHFAEMCYAIPLFEAQPTYWLNPKRIKSMSEDEQSLYFYLEKIQAA